MHDPRVVHHEGLSPAIKDMSPRIPTRPTTEHSQFLGAWIELINAAVEIPQHAVLRFHLGMQEDAFLKINPPTRTTTPGTDGMVTVLNAKPGQHQLLHIGHVIAIRIL